MHLDFTSIPLNPTGVQSLRDELAGSSNLAAESLIDHILRLGAKLAILETPYIDKDYSADYQTFYAAGFKDYPRQTRRIHIFSADVSASFNNAALTPEADDDLQKSYLGFIVVRPLQQGPIGRTVLKFPSSLNGLCIRPAGRAKFDVHVLGKTLTVSGAPFIQQDRRIGACAQAAIWMADRVVHVRHQRTGWHSVADITQLATTPTDLALSLELPAGSTGLNPVHIIRALKGIGHQPLCSYFGDRNEKKKEHEKGQEEASPPSEVIFRYLDSGLPVIFGIEITGMSHAVTAVGFVEATGGVCRMGAGYDAFVRAFVVHDDQRGPYRYMPLTAADIPHLPNELLLKHDGKVLVVDEVVTHTFVPLPSRVLLRAESADDLAGDFLDLQVTELGEKLVNRAPNDLSKAAIESFYEKVRSKKLVRRTYLTSAARYRHHLARYGPTEQIKSELMTRTLPHFIWVTELLDPDAKLQTDGGPRLILGHTIFNATSTADPEDDLLVAHYPHVVIHRDINGEEDEEPGALIFDTDNPYPGRVRGH